MHKNIILTKSLLSSNIIYNTERVLALSRGILSWGCKLDVCSSIVVVGEIQTSFAHLKILDHRTAKGVYILQMSLDF